VRRIDFSLVVILAASVPGCTLSSGGPGNDTPGSESVSEIALADTSGAVAIGEGGNGRFDGARATACQTLPDALTAGACSGGALSIAYDGCQFKLPNNTFLSGVWKGEQDFSFLLNASSTCPSASIAGKPLSSLQQANGMMTRTFASGTTRVANGVTVTVDTTTWGGWDSKVPLPASMGTLSLWLSTASRGVNILGMHHVATAGGVTLWDHTVNTPTALNATGASATVVSGTVQVQHNKIQATFQTDVQGLTFDVVACGCFPTSGTLVTTCVNDATGAGVTTCKAYGTETLTINPPGAGQACATSFTVTAEGGKTTGTAGTHAFSHCW
jgi:hypothetical protein